MKMTFRALAQCALVAIPLCYYVAGANAQGGSGDKVTVQKDASAYTLSNGICVMTSGVIYDYLRLEVE